MPLASSTERIALFGGTFDPVHLGHLNLAEAAHQQASLDRVIFVPCRRSPHKSGETGADGSQRLKMLELAIESTQWGWAECSPCELERQPPSYAWETMEHFQTVFPGADLAWIVGTDQWNALPRWAKPEFLRRSLRFLVAPRSGEKVEARPGWQHQLIPFDHPASATDIRAARPGSENWLPEPVKAYIREHRLYHFSS